MSHIVSVELGERSYPVVFGTFCEVFSPDGVVGGLCRGRSVLLAADANADRCHPEIAEAVAGLAARCEKFIVPSGEEFKVPEKVIEICRFAAGRGLGRDALFVAAGGGVTGDLAGFAASIYMRGVPCVQIPTTLLAMVDSSIGGKTGCDLPEGKNLIGTFHQPAAVGAAPEFLGTLPESETVNGMGEVAKYALGFDRELFEELERNPVVSASTIRRCAAIKAEVVSGDERESDGASARVPRSRELLNLGHTYAHAIETATGYRVPHGAAVGIGCRAAAALAVARGILPAEMLDRIDSLWPRLGLEIRVPGAPGVSTLTELMRRDKKRRMGRHRLVAPCGPGLCRVLEDVSEDEIAASMEA